MSFDAELSGLMRRCPGTRGALIVDPDGIPVAMQPRDATLEAMGAEFASVLKGIHEAGREFQHGGLVQFTIYAEAGTVVLSTLAAGYFLMLVQEREGLAGKARFLSRLAALRLHSEFI